MPHEPGAVALDSVLGPVRLRLEVPPQECLAEQLEEPFA